MTNTPRLALYEPQSSDVVDSTAHLDTQLDKIDALIDTAVWSSTNKPFAPYIGQLIFESDTGNIDYWDGTVWQNWGNSNRPLGRIAYGTVSVVGTTVAANAEQPAPHMSLTFSVDSTRLYKIIFQGTVKADAGNNSPCVLRFRWATGASVDTTGALCFTGNMDCNDNGFPISISQSTEFPYYFPSTGTVTLGVFLARPNLGTQTNHIGGFAAVLAVEDIGDTASGVLT
jgi:hypothetical protein